MRYKTIVLHLLEDRPEMYESLRRQRMLLATMERHAKELKIRHLDWMDRLSQAKPGRDPSQIASEAMEMAIQELVERLPSDSSTEDEDQPLDDLMTFLRAPMPGE